MTVLFWIAVFGVVYPYLGYPLLLSLLSKVRVGRQHAATPAVPPVLPSVSLIVPVHNEAARLERKIVNTAALHYPTDKLQVLFVSDGSTDHTVDLLRQTMRPGMSLVELPVRAGKAAALNAGLAAATHDVLVFTDASIELEPESLERLVAGFADPAVGCISGEDRIAGSGGEALYGRYELMLRRLESAVHSIAGASGSFYAQRRSLCRPFVEGMAPDFLSVLRTVEQGARAISEPTAIGSMTSVKDPRREFERKVRTLIRGMTTLFGYLPLLDPARSGWFAFILLSHKIMRWLAPVFLLGVLLTSLALLPSPFFGAVFAAQIVFYLIAVAAFAQVGGVHQTLPGKVALYFSSVNLAILVAWVQFARGVRQELWTPSAR